MCIRGMYSDASRSLGTLFERNIYIKYPDRRLIDFLSAILNWYIYDISTTDRTQSPSFICSNAPLILARFCRCVMNSSTISWPLR